MRDIRNLDEAFRSVKEYTPDLYNQGGLERIRASLESPQAQQHPGKWTPKAALEVSRYLRSSASRTLANRAATSDMIDGALAAKKGASLHAHLDHKDSFLHLTQFQQIALLVKFELLPHYTHHNKYI